MLERCLARVDGVRYDLGMIKGTATQTLTLHFNGSEAQLVELVDEIAFELDGAGLDSYDAGDAMGWIIRRCAIEGYEFRVERRALILSAQLESDNFVWEGLHTSQPVRR